MDIPEQLQRRAEELCDLSRAHPRPWLAHLLGISRVQGALCASIARTPPDPSHLRDVCLARRLKPTAEERDFAFVAIETELSMMAGSSHLVRELDGPARRRCSFATPVVFASEPYWSLESFRDQRSPGGAYRRYREAQADIQNGAPFVAATDVRQYFPSLNWSPILEGVTYACGWPRKEVAHALRSLGKLRMALQGRHSGLPVGLDLSYVLGNAILAQVDDLLEGSAHDGLAARWLDDISIGVGSSIEGWDVVSQIADGPLRTLNVRLHPAKTAVVPAWAWEQTKTSLIETDRAESVNGLAVERLTGLIEESCGPLPRPRAKGIMQALEELGLDAEYEAEVLTDYAAELTLVMPDLGKRVRALVGEPTPTKFTDRLLKSCHRTPTNSGWEGEVAEQMLYLDRWRVELGSAGRAHLRRWLADRNRSERARVTAGWVLARRAGEHDRAVLERLNEMSVPAARGAVGAAHFAGAKLENFHYRQASLTA